MNAKKLILLVVWPWRWARRLLVETRVGVPRGRRRQPGRGAARNSISRRIETGFGHGLITPASTVRLARVGGAGSRRIGSPIPSIRQHPRFPVNTGRIEGRAAVVVAENQRGELNLLLRVTPSIGAAGSCGIEG